MNPSLYLLTGQRGSGKTTLCSQLAKLKTAQGWRVSGLLSPARRKGKGKTGIEAQDVRTGETRLLASQISGEISGFHFGPWHFDPAVLAWGNQVLEQSIPTDLLIIDELGPLEFELAAGWIKAFDVLTRGQFRAALVVVRPECLEDAQNRLKVSRIFDADSRDGNLLEEISGMLNRTVYSHERR